GRTAERVVAEQQRPLERRLPLRVTERVTAGWIPGRIIAHQDGALERHCRLHATERLAAGRSPLGIRADAHRAPQRRRLVRPAHRGGATWITVRRATECLGAERWWGAAPWATAR